MDMESSDASPVTRGDLRTELRNLRSEMKRSLAVEIVKLGARTDDRFDSLHAEIRDGNSKVLKVVEDFAVQFQKVDRDQIITRYRVDELEKRVKILES